MQRFDQRNVLITGAGSGIGRAAARRFAEEGARLVLVDRNQEGLEETAAHLPEGTRVTLRTVDVSDEQAVNALVEDVLAAHGHDYSTITDSDTETWQAILGVNLMGPMFFIRAVGKHMQAQGGGAIVNTASVAGIRSGAGGNAYSASKAAVINLTKTAACDLGQYNVRVNAVCPGLIETGMTKPVFDYARDNNKEQKLGSRCELRRYGRPEEIAAAMAFLASDDASYITGQALAVDGGNTASLNLPGMKH